MTVTASQTPKSSERKQPTGLALWWKNNGKMILPPIFGIGGFLLFWQLSASLGFTKLAGPLSLFTEERTRELLFYPFFDRGGLDKEIGRAHV